MVSGAKRIALAVLWRTDLGGGKGAAEGTGERCSGLSQSPSGVGGVGKKSRIWRLRNSPPQRMRKGARGLPTVTKMTFISQMPSKGLRVPRGDQSTR